MEIKEDKLFPKTISEVAELEKYYKKDITNIIEELGKWTTIKQFVNSSPDVVLGAKEDAGVVSVATDNNGNRWCIEKRISSEREGALPSISF